MKIKIVSLLGNQPKYVTNTMDISSISDLNTLIKMCITDRSTTIIRNDGMETSIVSNGTVRDEVYNQKSLLVAWCNLETDEFPAGGAYKKGSI